MTRNETGRGAILENALVPVGLCGFDPRERPDLPEFASAGSIFEVLKRIINSVFLRNHSVILLSISSRHLKKT